MRAVRHRLLPLLLVAGGTVLIGPAPPLVRAQTPPGLSAKILQMERDREEEFEAFFGEDLASVEKEPDRIAADLERMSRQSGQRSALLYAIPRGDHLHLVLIPPGGTPIVRDLYEVPDERLVPTAARFHSSILRLDLASSRSLGRQLHEWIVAPFAGELEAMDIDLLLFCLGDGLKGLALSALHDGEGYLIERYALTRIPAFNLIEARAIDRASPRLLAAAASRFKAPDVTPLPAVSRELEAIGEHQTMTILRDEAFTRANVERRLVAGGRPIVHVASHAQFRPGSPQESYLQLWDSRLSLDQFDALPWDAAGTELLVLSACQTSVGDAAAENGFAGLALKAGVPAAIGTLWPVQDVATARLMARFYQALPDAPTTAAALRDAQLSLLKGDDAPGPDSALPYFWAGFTMLSSPW
ncbi:CHAT domain-containing protein [Synechococcus sp. RSCCF101]|uniref:CHAT domain-containing protein n=1 Tax=Synechococcus sp. RSCCF101 TaxID=2511069 RepID=UPI001248683C|nr:CHAT domain-containing protein [Synechococcus sp. RSCCF101]QEY32824.1 CHAT domain-containing protein [Synechococcus sp. RSCCF101]